jgi:hypothetical protein
VQIVEVDHISVVMLGVMVLKGLLAVVRRQGGVGVRQGWEGVFHGVFPVRSINVKASNCKN